MDRLLELLKEKAFEQKPVTLASGRSSNFYIDVKRVSLSAEGSFLIGQSLFALIQRHFPQAIAAGGLTLGADPLATAVAYASWQGKKELNAFIVRKETKSHGLKREIEGTDLTPLKSPVVVLEDVVTTGKSSLEAIEKCKSHGWQVVGVAAVVDREEGGRENIEALGIKLHSLFRKQDFGIRE